MIANALVLSSEESDRLDGCIGRGMIHEDGGRDLTPDLAASLDGYRRTSLIATDSVSFLNLARVNLKRKQCAAALQHLQNAASFGITAEVPLGFAAFHEKCPPVDASESKRCYAKAALRGRFSGIFGYSRVARSVGQGGRALIVDSLRILFGPLIALLLADRARYQF